MHKAQFLAIDTESDRRAAEHYAIEEEKRKKYEKAVACDHRRHAGFYNVKCFHPDRSLSSGGSRRRCLMADCPII